MARWTFFSLMGLMLFLGSCSKKDVDRNGNIRLRGEEKISLQGKSRGEFLQKGQASWYGKKYHGRKTSNGETYNMYAFTAAHKTLPFNAIVFSDTSNINQRDHDLLDRGF